MEADKLFKRDGDILVMSVITGKYITTFWYNDPEEFRTLSTEDFEKKIKIEKWRQIN